MSLILNFCKEVKKKKIINLYLHVYFWSRIVREGVVDCSRMNLLIFYPDLLYAFPMFWVCKTLYQCVSLSSWDLGQESNSQIWQLQFGCFTTSSITMASCIALVKALFSIQSIYIFLISPRKHVLWYSLEAPH